MTPLQAKVRRIPAANNREPFQCVHLSLQGTRSKLSKPRGGVKTLQQAIAKREQCSALLEQKCIIIRDLYGKQLVRDSHLVEIGVARE